MGFWAAVGEVVQKGAGGSTGVVGTELFENGPFKAFHQLAVGVFLFQPGQSQSKERM